MMIDEPFHHYSRKYVLLPKCEDLLFFFRLCSSFLTVNHFGGLTALGDKCTYKFPHQISILEFPHWCLQPINRDDVAVSQVGNPSVSVSSGTERVESFTVRVHVRATIEPPAGDMRGADSTGDSSYHCSHFFVTRLTCIKSQGSCSVQI